MNENVLKLFITGRTNRAQEAVRNLRELYEGSLSGEFDMVVIDVLENPEQAEDEKILATPTLIHRTPYGSSRIIGDLSDTEEVKRLLGIIDTNETHSGGSA